MPETMPSTKMNKVKIQLIIVVAILIFLPFTHISCEKLPTEPPQTATYYGYTIGFPVAFVKVLLMPLRVEQLYLWGILNFLLLVIALCIYRAVVSKRLILGEGFHAGVACFVAYMVVHTILTIFNPVYHQLFRKDLMYSFGWIFYFIAPYSLLNLAVNKVFPLQQLTIFSRLNFAFTSILYFLIGTLMSKIVKKLKK